MVGDFTLLLCLALTIIFLYEVHGKSLEKECVTFAYLYNTYGTYSLYLTIFRYQIVHNTTYNVLLYDQICSRLFSEKMARYPFLYGVKSQRELVSSISFQPPLYNFNVLDIAYLLNHTLVTSLLQCTYTWLACEIC